MCYVTALQGKQCACVCVADHYNTLVDKITYCNMEIKPSTHLYLLSGC